MALVSMILTSISTGIIFLLAAPIIILCTKAFFVQRRNVSGLLDRPDLYKCDDGKASEESQARYRAAVKYSAIFSVIAALVGFSIVLIDAVLQWLRSSSFSGQGVAIEGSLRTLNWVFILLLAACISIVQTPNDTYRAAVCGASCTFVIALLSGTRALILGYNGGPITQQTFQTSFHTSGILQLALCIAEFVAGMVLLVSFLSFPRKPELYTENGRIVDREHTVSAISHYTFHWCASVLKLGKPKESVQLNDLPGLAFASRAKTVHQRLLSSDHEGPLWKRIFHTHLTKFLIQWSLTLLQSVMQFVPQLSMYNLLRQLELRQAGQGTTSFTLIIWCFALGVSLLLNEWVQSWLYWIVFAQLAVPIRAQLSALVFAKALRKKNTKAFRKVVKPRDDHADGASESRGDGNAAGPTASSDPVEDEAAAKKSTEATINLVGVDASRVADFCSLNCLLVNYVFKICISTAFLIYLIGWRALLAGVLSFTLVTPLTTFVTKRYSVAEKALMALRDEKLGVVTEALHGIRQIKFTAIETAWEEKISMVREKELSVLWYGTQAVHLSPYFSPVTRLRMIRDTNIMAMLSPHRRIFVMATLLEFAGLVAPLLLSSVSLAVYVYFNKQLTPSVAFTTLAIFNSLETVVGLLPLSIAEFVAAKVSTDRIQEYLKGPERELTVSYAEEISFKNASIAWPIDTHDEAGYNDDQFVLTKVDITFPRGELTIISGETGAGKSLILASLVGEGELLAGVIKMPQTRDWSTRYDHAITDETWLVPGSLAFVAQIPWMENMSIKENILFTLPMNKSRYETALWACSLEYDLELLPDGDETEIGANGINLSGGQRWRVALARALYSRAEILVLDDVFSAVDAHVGTWILENALIGPLAQGRTRILATHHVSLAAPKAKYTVVLSNRTVAAAGPVTEDLIELAEQSSLVEGGAQNSTRNVSKGNSKEREFQTNGDLMASTKENNSKAAKQSKPQTFTQVEQRSSGAISARIFWTYFKASGGISAWILCLLSFLVARFMILGRSYWVKVWTSSYSTESFLRSHFLNSHNDIPVRQPAEVMSSNESGIFTNAGSMQYYITIYFALSIASCLANTFKELYISTLVIRGSRNLFAQMAHTVLRMPLRWIDTVPVGRILNRFTADFNSVDSRMAHDLGSMISSTVQVGTIIVAGFLVSPLVVVLGVVLVGFAVLIARRYLSAAREVKRLDSMTKSPVFEQFGSALIGLSTIRAFGNAQAYMEKMYGLIDDYTTTSWNLWLLNRWLSFNMGLIGVAAMIVLSVIIVSTASIDAALAGLALSFTLEFSAAVNWIFRRYANTELIMNAVERIHEYTELKTETSNGIDVPAAWPSEGRLLIKDLVAGYDEYSPPVLKGITFEASPNQRVGIVGRTGAGKSSLMLALFRFLEPRSGSIFIDGIDISKVKLFDLRSRLSIIPQDPGLFAGTIRTNLDPSNIHDDAKLHESLRRAHLTQLPGSITDRTTESTTPTNNNIFHNLSSPISESGLNLSQGQRQLLCLARALLSRPKLLILDEATSAVDMQTDTLIQRTLREEFANTTLLVIAHRLSTVKDFDRIVVMGDGMVREFGRPEELLAKRGEYWRMVRDGGGGGGRGDGDGEASGG